MRPCRVVLVAVQGIRTAYDKDRLGVSYWSLLGNSNFFSECGQVFYKSADPTCDYFFVICFSGDGQLDCPPLDIPFTRFDCHSVAFFDMEFQRKHYFVPVERLTLCILCIQ